MSLDSVAPERLREVLGCFATGITVVTCVDSGGAPVGVTVNSFNSVSLRPPLVSVCLDRRLFSLPAFLDADCFAVNILSAEQDALSARFAVPRGDKWSDVRHRPGSTGAPVLVGTLACVECRRRAVYDGGDHVVYIGEVLALDRSPTATPLLYFGGGYRRLIGGSDADAQTA